MQTKSGLIEAAGPKLRKLVRRVDSELNSLGCKAYVKTIYIGYEIDGVMVAAMYPHPDHVEIALALEENQTHELLAPADHLSWRTLPVSAVLLRESQFNKVKPLLQQATSRVGHGTHAVSRDNEYFKKRRGSSRGRSASARSPKAPTRKKPKDKRVERENRKRK